WASSDQAVGTYYIDRGTAQTPVLTPAPGTFTGEQSVTITTDTPGALIRYTTDDTEPGLLSPVYSAPVTLSTTTALRARAFAPSMAPSASAGGLYVIDLGTVDPPRFSPGAGSYTTQRFVTLSSATPGAVIRYRTDGQAPEESDPAVASGATILVDQTTTLKARAYKDDE